MVSDVAPSNNTDGPGTSIGPRRISEILLASIMALATAGEVEEACRLAGRACVALRGTDPATARRFDALLHRLTRKLTW
jgi:hypothetical protein